MTRQEALQFLNSQPALRAWAADTSVETTDNPLGWQSVIDGTFRALGLAPADAVPASKEQDARLLLRYYALEQFADLYAVRVDLNLALVGVDKKRSQAFRAISARLDEARVSVEALGYITGRGGLTIGRVTLDYIEPFTSLSY